MPKMPVGGTMRPLPPTVFIGPKTKMKIEGKEAESLLKLLEAIEELEDVQKVWANFDIDVGEMARVE